MRRSKTGRWSIHTQPPVSFRITNGVPAGRPYRVELGLFEQPSDRALTGIAMLTPREASLRPRWGAVRSDLPLSTEKLGVRPALGRDRP
jgi:hypothetical protein